MLDRDSRLTQHAFNPIDQAVKTTAIVPYPTAAALPPARNRPNAPENWNFSMCGRYTFNQFDDDLREFFGVEVPGMRRFNIAPSQPVPVITSDAVKICQWGFVPSWSKEPTVKFSNINARAETVATSNAYRGSFRHKRCLMPADGFYEWAPGPPKVPQYFREENGVNSFFRGWKG